jgi:murein DD-endopeptidase MepM/ murein hydrolase activator NlpD
MPPLLAALLICIPLALVTPPARAAPAAPAARFGWPVEPHSVVRRFDPPPRPWLAGHRGVDLASTAGAEVRAAGTGTVVFAAAVAGRGVVSIAHPGGFRTTYEPVTAMVRVGAHVIQGDLIGRLDTGHPGCPVAACLHWGLRRDDVYLDPLALLGLGRVRLLPLGGQP